MPDSLDEKTEKPKSSLRLGITLGQDGETCGLYLPETDRSTHLYVIGSSGVGKSKALANWIIDDLFDGRGCGVIDPHGDLIKDVVGYSICDADKVILVDLTDPEYIVGFNPLELQEGIDPFTQTLELVEVFRKIWNLSDDTTPRLLEILRNATFTLIQSGGTLLEVEPLLTDQQFRDEKIKYVQNEAVASFWRDRFSRWPERERTLYVESTLNKVSTFTSDPRIRLMLSVAKSTINFRSIMDSQKVVLINLSKGVLRSNSFLLGALFIAKIQMAAMSRQDLEPEQRKPFYLYVDEFQNYATESFCEIMSEARKYGLCLTLAHQSLEQLGDKLRAIILGNAKNFVCFRPDRRDAELLVKYIFEADPLSIKAKYKDRYDFYSLPEQWEERARQLVSLKERHAVLKTKGHQPCWFATYELCKVLEYEDAAEEIRKANFRDGYVKRLEDLDDSLLFFPTDPQREEPPAFVE